MRLTIDNVKAAAREAGCFLWVNPRTYAERTRYTLYEESSGAEGGRYLGSANTLAGIHARLLAHLAKRRG